MNPYDEIQFQSERARCFAVVAWRAEVDRTVAAIYLARRANEVIAVMSERAQCAE